MYKNDSTEAILSMESARLGEYGEEIDVIGFCEVCCADITAEYDDYYTSCDSIFCSRECVDKYYDIKEVMI